MFKILDENLKLSSGELMKIVLMTLVDKKPELVGRIFSKKLFEFFFQIENQITLNKRRELSSKCLKR